MARATKATDFYGGVSPSAVPAYTVADGARCLGLPASTVRSWVLGRQYKTTAGPATGTTTGKTTGATMGTTTTAISRKSMKLEGKSKKIDKVQRKINKN